MAVSLQSDIVLDVIRAAEPEAAETARARLAAFGGAAPPAVAFGDRLVDRYGRADAGGAQAASQNPMVKFEAMVLQNFIETMLPSDADQVYGGGLAGDIWRSLMAEQMAGVMAERGGIGIARSMLADYHVEDERRIPVGPVSGGPEKAETDTQLRLSAALVQELQRRLMQEIGGTSADTSAGGSTILTG